MVRRVEIHAVVAPAAVALEFRERHELQMRDAKRRQMRQPLDHRLEGAFGRERADVQFVDHRGW